ncbi:unnamed protein product, partial [Ascophyllum nodosum]
GDRVANVVAGDLCKVHHDSSDRLIAPLFLVVQQLPLWLVQGQFRLYYECVREVTAFHTVALFHVLRVVFLANVDGLLLTVTSDVHTEDPRHVVYWKESFMV